MKTAISMPDHDFARFEQAAAERGMSRSEFYRTAADKFLSQAHDEDDLTRMANAALERSGQPSVDSSFLSASEAHLLQVSEW